MTKKPVSLWDQVGFQLYGLHRRFWPNQSISAKAHLELRAEVKRLRSAYAQLQGALRSETIIGLENQARFLQELSVISQNTQKRAREIAREMVVPLEQHIVELTTERDQLRQLAEYDPLTELCNRRGLNERFGATHSALAHAIKRGEGERRHYPKVSAMMIDIDHFKKINDRYGHAVGDQVLAKVGEILRRYFSDKRPSDILCRWGGEEFLAILPQSDVSFAYSEACLLAYVLRSATILEGQVVTASIGVAEIELKDPATETASHILSRLCELADAALYRAKNPDQAGRGTHPGRDRVMH